jgi:hypothetical protein
VAVIGVKNEPQLNDIMGLYSKSISGNYQSELFPNYGFISLQSQSIQRSQFPVPNPPRYEDHSIQKKIFVKMTEQH